MCLNRDLKEVDADVQRDIQTETIYAPLTQSSIYLSPKQLQQIDDVGALMLTLRSQMM